MIRCSFREGALDMFPTPVSIESGSAQPEEYETDLFMVTKIIITLSASVLKVFSAHLFGLPNQSRPSLPHVASTIREQTTGSKKIKCGKSRPSGNKEKNRRFAG